MDHIKQKDTKTWQKAVSAIILLLIAVYALFAAYTWQSDSNRVIIHVLGTDTLDSATLLLSRQDYVVSYWRAHEGGYEWIADDDGSAAGSNSSVDVAQDETFYIAVMPMNRYVDKAMMLTRNPMLQTPLFLDINGDDHEEFVFPCSIQEGLSEFYFYPYFYSYDAPTIASPADIAGIGTQYIKWYLTFSSAKVAFAVVKAEVTLNTTDTAKIALVKLNIPCEGFIPNSQLKLQEWMGNSTYTWSAAPCNLNGATYLAYDGSQLNKFEFTAMVECSLVANETVMATLTIYGVSPSGIAVPPISDTINLLG